MRKDPQNVAYRLVFFGILAFHLLNNYFWISRSNMIWGIDVANHLFFQLKFHYLFKDLIAGTGGFLDKAIGLVKLINLPMDPEGSIYWPNFVYLVSTLFTLAFGTALSVVKMTSQFFFVILLIVTYFIGRDAFNRKTGLLAMFLVGMYPLVFESSREYGLDLPLSACVATAVYLLTKSDDLTKIRNNFFLGLVCGFGMLIKGQFFIFVICPFCVLLYKLFYLRKSLPLGEKIKRVSVVFIPAFLISSSWWFLKIWMAVKEISVHIVNREKFLETGGQLSSAGIFSLSAYLLHFKMLVLNSIGLFFSLVFLVSLVYFLKARIRSKLFLFSWASVPFLVFSCVFVVKHDRFLMPILPGIALISAWGLMRLGRARKKRIIFAAVTCFAFLQYFVLTYSYAAYERSLFRNLPVFGLTSYGAAPLFDEDKVKLTKIIADTIMQDAQNLRSTKLGVIDIHEGEMSPFELYYWLIYWQPGLIAYDWIESTGSFFAALPDFSYMLFITNRDDKISFYDKNEFVKYALWRSPINFRQRQERHDWNKGILELYASIDNYGVFHDFVDKFGNPHILYKKKQ